MFHPTKQQAYTTAGGCLAYDTVPMTGLSKYQAIAKHMFSATYDALKHVYNQKMDTYRIRQEHDAYIARLKAFDEKEGTSLYAEYQAKCKRERVRYMRNLYSL